MAPAFILPSLREGLGEGPRMKKAGRPEAARLSSPGEGTDQKLTVRPVTKAVPSAPLVSSSTPKIEVFHETPGASL